VKEGKASSPPMKMGPPVEGPRKTRRSRKRGSSGRKTSTTISSPSRNARGLEALQMEAF